MTTRRWVPTMLRARQAAEDAAALEVAQAHRQLSQARTDALAQDERMDQLGTPDTASAQAFLAATAARHAAAATHAAAHHRAAFAENRVTTGVAALGAAAQARRTVEKLAEREAGENFKAMLATGVRDLDEAAASGFRRAAGGEL